jgi:hypothetical protein
MSEISFIPCELCDELISFDDYTEHINECQRSYHRSSINRRYGSDYVFINSRLQRNLFTTTPSESQLQQPLETPIQSPTETPSQTTNTSIQQQSQDTPIQQPSSQQQTHTQLHNINTLLNNNTRTLEHYLNRLMRTYNEDEIIFNEELNRINTNYRINTEYVNNVNDNETDDETDDDMPSLIDEDIEENENQEIQEDNQNINTDITTIDYMTNINNPIYNSSIENILLQPQQEQSQQNNEAPEEIDIDNEQEHPESSTNISETEPSSVSNLTQNNIIIFNSSHILPQPPPSIPPPPIPLPASSHASVLNYPPRIRQSWINERDIHNVSTSSNRRYTFNEYGDYFRNTRSSTYNNIGNSYEELTRLGERIGNVSIGIEKIENICKDYIVKEEEEDCFVCREEFIKGDKMKQLLCGHYFCEDCINNWFKNNKKCPVCMVEYNDEGLIKKITKNIECEVSTYV